MAEALEAAADCLKEGGLEPERLGDVLVSCIVLHAEEMLSLIHISMPPARCRLARIPRIRPMIWQGSEIKTIWHNTTPIIPLSLIHI